MQTEIKLRKIVNEKDWNSPAGLLSSLAAVLDAMGHNLPEDGRVHELFIKKLDGNTIDHCDEGCHSLAYGNKMMHMETCRRGKPNDARRFLVAMSVSTGDSGEGDADA